MAGHWMEDEHGAPIACSDLEQLFPDVIGAGETITLHHDILSARLAEGVQEASRWARFTTAELSVIRLGLVDVIPQTLYAEVQAELDERQASSA